MIPTCIFCENESGSQEHLWAAWIHRRKQFGPIRVKEGTGPELIEDDPQKTISTVCHICNNTWMSRLEDKNIPALGDMLENKPTVIDPGRQRLLTEWAVKTAMVQDSIKRRIGNEIFYTRDERVAMRLNQQIPDRTRIWIGALTESHLGAFGTDFTIVNSEARTRIGTGMATTVIIGHFVVQVVTEHFAPRYAVLDVAPIEPRPGDWGNMLIDGYPKKQKQIKWPPTKAFTNGGPDGIAYLMHRWRMGERVDRVKPS
jgi:hypothetical protein